MSPYSVPVLLMAAVCTYVGLYYLWMYLRRRFDVTNFFFALSCLSIAAYDIFCAGLYNSASPVQGMFWQKWQFASLALFTVTTAWFIYGFTRYKHRLPVIIITVLHLAFFFAGIFIEGDLTLSAASPMPKHVEIPGLFSFTYNEVNPGVLYQVQYITMLLSSLFMLVMITDHYLNDDRSHARPMLISLSTFFVVAINDAFVGMAIYSFIFLVEYAYLFIILSMAYVLQNRFIDLHSEVEELNLQLEEKINERTMELFFSEVGTKLYSELLQDLTGNLDGKKVKSIKKLIESRNIPAIDRISGDISIIANIDGLLHKAVSKAVEITAARSGSIFIINSDNILELRASTDKEYELPQQKLDIVQNVFTRGTFTITSVKPTYYSESISIDKQQAAEHIMAIPIITRGITIGACYVENYSPDRPFTDREANLLMAFMDQVAIAVDNSFLYKKIKTDETFTKAPSLTPSIEEKVKKAITYLQENYVSNISREGLAASLNMHPDSLGRFFKMYTGKRINEFINELRVQKAADEILTTENSIIDIAYAVGFESLTTFNRAFLKVMKITPTEHRAKGSAQSDS